tara:strand:+ start:129 stop:392 length:264 start_codon:yes stop_codon:yes gene_type:complete
MELFIKKTFEKSLNQKGNKVDNINLFSQSIINMEEKLNIKKKSFDGFFNKMDKMDKKDIFNLEKIIKKNKKILNNLINDLLINYNKI